MILHPSLYGKYEFIIELLYDASQRQRRTRLQFAQVEKEAWHSFIL